MECTSPLHLAAPSALTATSGKPGKSARGPGSMAQQASGAAARCALCRRTPTLAAPRPPSGDQLRSKTPRKQPSAMGRNAAITHPRYTIAERRHQSVHLHQAADGRPDAESEESNGKSASIPQIIGQKCHRPALNFRSVTSADGTRRWALQATA